MRIIIGGIMQESNTFSPLKSNISHFYSHNYVVDHDVLSLSESQNEISGFIQACKEQAVEIVPTMYANAVSWGKIENHSRLQLKTTLLNQIKKAGKCDGILLAFHGSMAGEDCDDVEGDMLEAVRLEVGKDIPIVITLDNHANLTKQMISNIDGVIGYKTYPHIDFFETGYHAASLLFSIIHKKVKTHLVFKKIPMILPAENMQNTHGPMADLFMEAQKGEQAGRSIVTSLFPVQPWLDVDELGFGVVVVCENPEEGRIEVERLCDFAWAMRHEFDIKLYETAEVIAMALEDRSLSPIVFSDSADSPGAGATGDSNYVLAELLKANVQKQLHCLLSVVDAPAVAEAIQMGVGSTVELKIGYTLNVNQGQPITVKGIVKKISDGIFTFKGGFAADTLGHMGRSVVLQIDKISLLISENPVFTGDPAMYRSVGLEPLDADLVLVKSANQFRAEYEKVSKHIYILDTPGVSTANLKTLHFDKISRPFYPYDDDFNWKGN
ncbi:microcystinase C [Paenibacillus baekrokdamisoli]|uniref:Microcystinase C n=1 Tax=Paenibacillus baekrokdamisoli TaxID=1712516 RepID=A0A3G9IV41_9BACL|nr:M81 family metallopeptidase [Paenibacillus baekrokdamisoli]MBB3070959.1 microcystin degradation protein MlrC [Paenibacillus baekrokdamisoli]BBH22102.1 microcystinase C [Paenibacillus baekrokdamisoli]